MFDFNDIKGTIPGRNTFKYWFKRAATGGWDFYLRECGADGKGIEITDRLVCTIQEQLDLTLTGFDDTFSSEYISDITDYFVRFKERPEYFLGVPTVVYNGEIELNAKSYDIMFAGAMLVKADSDDIIPQIERCLKWLHSTDFYTAPASTRFHNAFDGGLVKHKLDTANRVIDLIKTDAFSMVNLPEAILVALSHDWCKINRYEIFMRNDKDEKTGKWNKIPSFRTKEDYIVPMGHGVSSMFMAQKFMRLSTEQALAIRWHMGRWNVSDEEVNEYSYATKNYPMVFLIQFADQLSVANF